MLTGKFANPTGGGTPAASMWFHVGANADQRVRTYIGTMTTQGLGVNGISLSTPENANAAISKIDQALDKVSKQRADLGAYQNRLEKATNGLLVSAENLQAAESIVRDANMAEEMVKFTRDSILVQSGTAMLAQANAKTQSVLQLLNV